jgi:hypothetical protein
MYCGAPGLTRIVNRAEEPHDSRRALLERVLGDGASGWSERALPPHTCARAAAFDTERRSTSHPVARSVVS